MVEYGHSTLDSTFGEDPVSINPPAVEHCDESMWINVDLCSEHAEVTDVTIMERCRRVADAEKMYREQFALRQQLLDDINTCKSEQQQQSAHSKLRDGAFQTKLQRKLSNFTKQDQAVRAARRDWEKLKSNHHAATMAGIAVFGRRISMSSERSPTPLKEPLSSTPSPGTGVPSRS